MEARWHRGIRLYVWWSIGGSLKSAADELGYTQSAVSQAVKALERELGTTIIERGKQGVSLTRDGKQYLPYLRQIVTAEAELEGKRQELLGLSSTDIRIATFTNVTAPCCRA